MWSIILKAAMSYIEAHPQDVEALIGEGITAGINAIKAHNAKSAVPAK